MIATSSLVQLTRNVGLTHALCVILGAPIIDRVMWTFCFSLVFVLVGGGRPYELYFPREEDEREEIASGSRGDHHNSNNNNRTPHHHKRLHQQQSIASRTIFLAVLSWVGGIFAPLDWDVWFQLWPLPSTVLLVMGTLVLAIPGASVLLENVVFARLGRGCWAPADEDDHRIEPIQTSSSKIPPTGGAKERRRGQDRPSSLPI